MALVPKVFADLTPEQIEEYGYLGVSEEVVFNLLGLNDFQRKIAKGTDKWTINYARGVARREVELAKKLIDTEEPTLIKELIKGTTITEKKIVEDKVEYIIEAPEWVKKNAERNKTKNKRRRI